MAGDILALRAIDTYGGRFKSAMGNRARTQANIRRVLSNVRADVIRQMATYPPQNPDTEYQRTGDYGRSWAIGSSTVYTDNSVRIVNRVQHYGRAYAVYVGGPTTTRPGQSRWNGRYGWVSITDVAKDIRRRYPRILTDALVGPML